MTARVVLLGLAVAAAWVIVALSERRRAGSSSSLAPGVTVVVGASCRLCPPLIRALRDRGVAPNIVDVDSARVPGVQSVPTLFVVDHAGRVRLRRSGASALADVDRVPALVRRTERAAR